MFAGTISASGGGYRLTVRAVETTKGDTVTTASEEARSKSDVLQAVGRVAESMRRALGDAMPSDQLAAETFTAASLEAVKNYTIAQTLSVGSQERGGDRRTTSARFTEDKNFGRAYAGWAAAAYRSRAHRRGQASVRQGAAAHRSDDGTREVSDSGRVLLQRGSQQPAGDGHVQGAGHALSVRLCGAQQSGGRVLQPARFRQRTHRGAPGPRSLPAQLEVPGELRALRDVRRRIQGRRRHGPGDHPEGSNIRAGVSAARHGSAVERRPGWREGRV